MNARRRTLLAAIGAAGAATLGGSMNGHMGTELARQIVNANRPAQLLGLSEASATLAAWNPDALRGTIHYNGVVMEDLPVMATIDAFGWQAGDEVVIRKSYPPNGRRRAGFGSWYIAGRIYRPGAANAQRVLDALRSRVAKQISAEVFAERVHAAENPASGGTSSITYTETLAGGDGPVVADVEVSEVGLAIVGVQAQISIIANPGQTNTAFMSYQVTGATDRAAFDVNAKRTDIGDTDEAHITNVTDQSMSWSIQDGLNPGLHTFETMYRANYAAAFAQRRIIVIAL